MPFGRVVRILPRSRTGTNNPKWITQVKNGQNATTPMTGIIDTIDCTPGVMWLKCRPPPTGPLFYTLTLSGEIAGILATNPTPFNWSPMSASTAYNRGLTQYLKRVGEVNRAFSGGTFVGELRETLRMIRNPAQGIRNILDSYMSDLKGQKKRSPKNWKKNLSSTWLEYAFGLVPLIHDIQDATKAYNRLVEEPTFIPVSAAGVHDVNVPGPVNTAYNVLISGFSDLYCPKIFYDRRSTDKAIVKFRGYVRRDSRATLAGKAALFGFTPEQIIPTAWELLPWSFLVDYFTNIGDICETAVVNQGSIAWTNVSEIVIQTSEYYVRVADATLQTGSERTVGGEPSTARIQRRRVNRYVPTSLSLPNLTFEVPGRPAQWANMTALFAQAQRLHPQRFH